MKRDIVVIGASAGGLAAIVQLASILPPNFAAAVLVALHVDSHSSVLPQLITGHGPNRAVHPADGDPLLHGIIYVAPPDHHMMLRGESILLTRGPKEHHTRPAADPLFRSAALAFGPRVIGVVLTGRLDDGTAGLQAIKACGGIAIVQEPSKAQEPSMPLSALKYADIDHCVPLDALGTTLERLVQEEAEGWPPQLPQRWVDEHYVGLGRGDTIETLNILGKSSTFVCPECRGVLWELNDVRPTRYRCHTGHGFSACSLDYTQSLNTEDTIWSAIRALRDREALLRRLIVLNRAAGEDAQVAAGEALVERLASHSLQLRRMMAE